MDSNKLISFLDNYKTLSREKVEEFLQSFEDEIAIIQNREARKVAFNVREPKKLVDILFGDDEVLKEIHYDLFDHAYRGNVTPPVLPYDNTVNDKLICLFDVRKEKTGVILLNDLLKAEMEAYFDDFLKNKVDLYIFSNEYDKKRIILDHDFVNALPCRENKDGEMVVDSYINSLFNKYLFEYEAAIYFFSFIDESIKSVDDFYNNRKYILEGFKSLFDNKQASLEEEADNLVPFKVWEKKTYQNSKQQLKEAMEIKYTKEVNSDIAPEFREIFDNIARMAEAYFVAEKKPELKKIFGPRMKEKILDKFSEYYMHIKEFI